MADFGCVAVRPERGQGRPLGPVEQTLLELRNVEVQVTGEPFPVPVRVQGLAFAEGKSEVRDRLQRELGDAPLDGLGAARMVPLCSGDPRPNHVSPRRSGRITHHGRRTRRPPPQTTHQYPKRRRHN